MEAAAFSTLHPALQAQLLRGLGSVMGAVAWPGGSVVLGRLHRLCQAGDQLPPSCLGHMRPAFLQVLAGEPGADSALKRICVELTAAWCPPEACTVIHESDMRHCMLMFGPAT